MKYTKAVRFFVTNVQTFWPEQVSLFRYLEKDAFHGLTYAIACLLWSVHNASKSHQS